LENINRRLRRLEDKLDGRRHPENREVVSEETRHAIQAILELRQEGAWEPYDVASWDWMTRQQLEEHLRDLLLEKGVGRDWQRTWGHRSQAASSRSTQRRGEARRMTEDLDRRLHALEMRHADECLDALSDALARSSEEELVDLAAFARDSDEEATLGWLAARGISEEDFVNAFALVPEADLTEEEMRRRSHRAWERVPRDRKSRVRAAVRAAVTHTDQGLPGDQEA
jgi:hypothetical protein